MGISQKAFVLVVLVGVGLAVSGCATQAARQAQALNTGATAANNQMAACVGAAQASPGVAVLWDHIPKTAGQATLQQLADEGHPDDQQIAALFAVNQMYQDCRKPFLAAYSTLAPGIAMASMDAYQKADGQALLLVQKKITWGEYNKAMGSLAGDFARTLTAEGQKINAALQQENNAEMEQRQRAAAAFAQYMQNQQAIAAANRPIVTNCNTFGTSTNCVTH